MIQALRLMSDMQRQQGEQLGQILVLLTPEPVDPRANLGELLRHLTGVIGELVAEVKKVGEGLERITLRLPAQMAAAIDEAVTRAETRGVRR